MTSYASGTPPPSHLAVPVRTAAVHDRRASGGAAREFSDRLDCPTITGTWGACEFGVVRKRDGLPSVRRDLAAAQLAPHVPRLAGVRPAGPLAGLAGSRIARYNAGDAL